MRSNGAASMTPAVLPANYLLLNTRAGRNWLNVETVESCEGVHVAQPAAQQMSAREAPCANPPTHRLLRASEAPGRSTYMCNALTGHSNAKAGSASSSSSLVGTLCTYPVGWPEHKALFAYRKCLEVPDPFDGSECSQERCLSRQEFQLDWVQWLKGTPLKSSQDNREVPGGHQGWSRGIHPPGTTQEPHDEIMLSQGPAVHCIVMGRDTLSRWRVTAYAPTFHAGKKALLQSCIFGGLLGEKNTNLWTDSISMHRLMSVMSLPLPVVDSSGLPRPVHEPHMKVPQIWTRVPYGAEPLWKEVLPQWNAPGREGKEKSHGKWVRQTRSGWACMARPAGPAPHPPWACTVSVRAGSLGETHTCVKPEASCVPVHPCRGGPRSGRSTAGSGRTRGRQTGLLQLPRIDSRSDGSSRDGVAILRGMWAVVRAHRLYDGASSGCGQRKLTHACLTVVAGTAVRLDRLPTALGSWCAKAVEAHQQYILVNIFPR